ncbi:MAG: hypothetical protein ACOX89_04280, partial [Lutispora sp.]
MELERRKGETPFEHHKRLVRAKLVDKTLSDIDYAELSPFVYGGKEYSSDVTRRMMYGSRYTIDLLEQEAQDKLEDMNGDELADDVLESIKQQRLELQKERYKLQTEKLELNREIRELSRIELWEEKMRKIAETMPPFEVVEFSDTPVGDKVAITGIADPHFGAKINIKNLFGEMINYYNEKVFQERMWLLKHKIQQALKKEGINKIVFLMLGDLIDGILRVSQLRSLQYGIIDSVMKYSEFMAVWLDELSRCLEAEPLYIDVYTSLG